MIGWLFSKYLEKKDDADPTIVFGVYMWLFGCFSGLSLAAWVILFKVYDN